MEPKEKFTQLRNENTVSPGKNLDTLVGGNDNADVFVGEAVAREAVAQTDAVVEWAGLLDEFPQDSLEAAVINRAIDETQLVAAAANQVLGETDNSKAIAEFEERLFDYYSPNLFFAAAKRRLEMLEKVELPVELEPARALVADKLAVYADQSGEYELERPERATLDVVGSWLNGQFDDLFDELDNDGLEKYDASQITEVFNAAMQSTPALRNQGWKTKQVVREKNAISTYSSKREVVVPSQRVVTKAKLKGLTVHEVFGHALRSAIAEESGIPVADHGTATYARFEESFLMALEQCLAGEYDPNTGVNHYLAIGMSVTGGESKDEIADLFESIHMLNKGASGIDDAVKSAALRLTNTQIKRTFVGMTDVDDGVAHRKDIDYLHGLNDSWRLLNYISASDEFDAAMKWLLSAKFNPFTKEEREMVSGYVTPPQVIINFFNETV